MSRRQWFSNARYGQPGLVFATFGFITTNIGTNPDMSLAFGCGGLTGPDAAGTGVANSSPSLVSTITKTANNGEFLVTLADGWRKVYSADPNIMGPNAGPADGYSAQACVPSNEGSGHDTAVTFLVTVCNAAGTPTETTGRRVSVDLVLKDSGLG